MSSDEEINIEVEKLLNEMNGMVSEKPEQRKVMVQPFIDEFNANGIVLTSTESKMIEEFIASKIQLSELTEYFVNNERLRKVLEKSRS